LLLLWAAPLVSQPATGQAQPTAASSLPPWQIAAGSTLRFQTASIRLDKSGTFKKPNFPLSADDGLPPSDGTFYADFPLIVSIQFAYKLWFTPEETRALYASLPKWVLSDAYEIRAQAAGKPTKDQMRLMLQSLLAERFGLKVHFEDQQLRVFALTLIKPGKLGPKLSPHVASCAVAPPAKEASAKDVFPPPCLDQALMTIPKPNHVRLTGTRNTTMPLIATYLSSIGELDRPVIDQTGLEGRFDFSLEFTPDSSLPAPGDPDAEPGPSVTTFRAALQEQLGLKLEATKAVRSVLVVDAVERPTEN
jgi:uncharacterized protein (TIGR03435 family)